eukprot:m.79686 g.79686  ORF g.79686 m.79686 type:complete len:518 (-) comp9309_c0_seq1:3396-4949(-)
MSPNPPSTSPHTPIPPHPPCSANHPHASTHRLSMLVCARHRRTDTSDASSATTTSSTCAIDPLSSSIDAHANDGHAAVPEEARFSPMGTVPCEVLQKILCHVGSRWILTHVPRVCKRWAKACRNVPAVIFPMELLATSDDNVIHRCIYPPTTVVNEGLPDDCRLFASEDAHDVAAWLVALAGRCRIIRVAPLVGYDSPFAANIPDELIVHIVNHLPDVRHLELGWVHGRDCPAAASSVFAVAASRAHLRTLNFWRGGVTDQMVKMLADQCPLLEHVTLRALSTVTDTSLKVLAARRPKLATLTLTCIQPGPNGSANLSDYGIIAIANACTNLTNLSLTDGSLDVSNDMLRALGSHCRHLELFRCGPPVRPTAVTDAGVAALATGCPKLAIMSINGPSILTDDSIRVLAKTCPRMIRIRFDESRITDEGLRVIGASWPEMKCVDFGRTSVTDDGVLAMIAACPVMTHVVLPGCQRLTDRSASQIMVRHLLTDMSECPLISQDILTKLDIVVNDERLLG